MELLTEGNKVDENIKLSSVNKVSLKELIGNIYALGYQMGRDRGKFNSEEVYQQWLKNKPNENYLELLNDYVKEVVDIFESESIKIITVVEKNPTIFYNTETGIYNTQQIRYLNSDDDQYYSIDVPTNDPYGFDKINKY